MTQHRSENRNKRIWILLLLLLLLMASVSGSILGYILGKRAVTPSGGEMLDTIKIMAPMEETMPQTPPIEGVVSVAGQVRYTDGTPVAHHGLQLHSTPRETVTDQHGCFFFHLVETGEHTLYLLDARGNRIGQLQAEVAVGQDGLALIRISAGNYTVEIHEHTLLLELDVIVDREALETARESQGSDTPSMAAMELETTASFLPDGTYYCGGEKTTIEKNELLRTEYRNWLMSDGTVWMCSDSVLLHDQTLIKPYGQITYPGGREYKSKYVVRRPDGAAIIPSGTILTRDGYVIFPGTAVVHPDFDITIKDGTTIDGGTMEAVLPDGTLVKPAGNTVTLPNGTILRPGESQVVLPDGTVVDLGKETLTQPDGTVITPGEGTIEGPEPPIGDGGGAPGPGGVEVYSENQTWTQHTYVNLFAGMDLLYPGMEGQYPFRMWNGRFKKVECLLTFQDTHDTPVPFEYWLTDGEGNPLPSNMMWIPQRESRDYVLHWRWPYESGDDGYDTMLGNSGQRSHTVTITIQAEELA